MDEGEHGDETEAPMKKEKLYGTKMVAWTQ